MQKNKRITTEKPNRIHGSTSTLMSRQHETFHTYRIPFCVQKSILEIYANSWRSGSKPVVKHLCGRLILCGWSLEWVLDFENIYMYYVYMRRWYNGIISPVTVYLNQKLNENKKISSQIKQNERREGKRVGASEKNPTGIFCQSFDFFVRLTNANEREEVKQAANRHERR